MINYGYRFYKPQIGRWINRDPIAERSGWNLYAGMNNSPIHVVDAYGLQSNNPSPNASAPKQPCCGNNDPNGNPRKPSNRVVVFIQQKFDPNSWDRISIENYHTEVGFIDGANRSPTIGLEPGAVRDEVNDRADSSQGADAGVEYDCRCLSDQELQELKARYDKFKKEGSNPNPPWGPKRTCAMAGSEIVGGLGCPNIQPITNPTGSKGIFETVDELVKQLDANKFCTKRDSYGHTRSSGSIYVAR